MEKPLVVITYIDDQVAFVEGPVNIGIINSDQGTVLIDTGIDNSIMNKVIKQIGRKPIAALVTHHHADHMGGISKLNSLGISHIFTPPREIPFFMDTFLEPLIFCGFHPPKELTNRHLMAKPAKTIHPISEQPFSSIKAISTPGHSIDHFAFLVGKTLFSGDSVFKEETIEKHKLLFASNPNEATESIIKISKLDIDHLALGHGGAITGKKEIKDACKINIEHYQTVAQSILRQIPEQGGEIHEIVGWIYEALKLKKEKITQYILYRHTILGHISNLITKGKLEFDGARAVPT
ncbi:MAG: MBL fold metallo-hydrolase [Methanobacteriota archaeon]|nr:MAG: MBL fold metallo-hydrolase [Euryarchaeota archaeon]